MLFPRSFPLALLVLLALPACASSTDTREDSSRHRADLITWEDIEESGFIYGDAYQLVQRLHPEWLRRRGGRLNTNEYQEMMEGDIVVYVNDVRMGGPTILREVHADSIEEIRYLDTATATRLGTGHQHGALLVQTR